MFVRFKSRFACKPIDVALSTDEHGAVSLGPCRDVEAIAVYSGVSQPRVWNLDYTLAAPSTRFINAVAGEDLVVHLPRPVKTADIRLVKVAYPDGDAVSYPVGSLKLADDGLAVEISRLEAGCYCLEGADVFIDIRVVASTKDSDLDEWSSGLVLGDKAILARESNVVASETTRVTNVDSKADQISLTLLNASPNTVVEVLLNNFLPFDVDSGAFAQHRESAFHGTTLRADSNSFTSEKDLPEELNYVIARKSKPKGLGNLLRKPGVLLSTWKLRSTSLQSSKLDVPAPASCESSGSSGSSESIMMRKGGVNRYHRYHAAARSGAGGAEAFADEGYMAYNVDMGSAASVAAAPVFSDRMDPITTEDQANYSFLVHPGEVLYSLKPNSDGRVLVTLTSTSTPRTALIIVTDGSQVVVRQVFVPGSAMDSATVAVRDIALKPSWSVDAHVAEHNQISTVVAGDAFSMLGGSTFCVISTLAKLLELGETLCAVDEEKERFVAFRFLANWSSMSNEKKRSLYGEHGCHELNLFIRFKDPGFFDEVVRPFIACKAFKQPIDHFLLGNREQCAEYLANPSAFARLNIAEKLLLGSFVGGDSNSSVERWVLDDLRKKEARPGSSVERARFREQFFKTVMATLGAGERPSEPKDSQTDAMPPPPPSGMAFGAASAAPPIAMAMMAAPAPKAAPPPPPAPVMAGAPSIQAVSRRSGPTHDLALRTAARQQASEGQGIYEPLEATSEWGERQWWKRKDPSPALVENSAFWRDWIGCSDRSSFLSENLDQVLRYTFTEAIVAVSLMAIGFGGASDADYEAKQPADAALTALDLSFTARRPLIVLHKGFQVSETKLLPTLLVGQHFYDPDHRQFFDPESGETVDRYLDLGENLVPLRRYGCQVTLTSTLLCFLAVNWRSSPSFVPFSADTSAVQHLLTVLHQIPEGAIPVANSVPTKSETVSLRPFETLLFDFSFYFPRAGKFQQYPVHVSDRRQMIVAHGEPVTLVVERPQSNVVTEDVKREFWWMASEGTGEELLAWLADERNVIEPGALGSLLWRLKDRKMFVDVVESLRRRKAFDRHVWSYALLHGLPVETKEWMSATSWIISAAMPFGQGPLLAADALELGQIELVEYWPLVNARAFQIGDRPRVNNREAIATLEATTRYLFHKPTFRWSSGDHLHLICLLLAQDRFSEAKNAFETLASLADAGTIELEQRVQYDYARAWMSFLEDPASNSLQVAREIADRYKAYPVPHWNGLFAELGRAVKELDALRHGATSIPLSETEEAVLEETSDTAAAEGAREARQAARCRKEPRLEFQPSDGIDKLSLSHANLQECVVGFHPLDLEVEFSTRPFGGDGGSAEAASNPALFIWPVDSRKIEFAAGEEETTVDLPSTLKNTNLVIDVSAKDGEIVRSKVAGQSSMIIQVLQQSGMFQVFTTDRKPVASAYVKVYARLTDKSVVFYKDGFTDVLGRFDYASLSNTSLLQRTERFAILVADEQLGSAVKQASAPKS